jgi:hypothetical protein
MLAAVVTGVYSWGLTVLPPLSATGPGSLAGVAAGCAIVSLLVSPLLPPGRIALAASLDFFVGFCILSWWAGRHHPIEPPFAIFGSFGWLAYTLALGALSTPHEPESEASPGAHLSPRTPPSKLSAAALALALLGSLVLLGSAWKIERPAISVLAHVFALATVLILLRSGAHMATYLQVRGTKLVKPSRLRPALWPLFWLTLLLLGAGAALFLRS